jgi:hypothetical protein
MYVLWLDAAERDYLLSLLKKRRASTAEGLKSRLRSSDDVFGVVMWSDADIALQLQEQGVLDSPENIEAIRQSYYVRHVDDAMIERGWAALEQAVSELKDSGMSPVDPGAAGYDNNSG